MKPEQLLKHGTDFPYDNRDSFDNWWTVAALGVLADLSDRRGFIPDDVDDEIKTEIVDSLAEIIRLAEAMPTSEKAQ